MSAALGLVVADLVLPEFTIDWTDWWGFVLCVVIFAILQSVLALLPVLVIKKRLQSQSAG